MALRKGLTESTMNSLVDRNYGSIKAFREIVEEDLESLPLYMGQRLILMNVVEEVNTILEGFDIDDTADGIKPEETAPVSRLPVLENSDHEESGTEQSEAPSDQDGREEAAAEQSVTVAPRKVPRPHDFIVGKNSSKELNMEEFLYGNLLILEYMMEQKSPEVRAYMKHLRFMVLKVIHGYPLDSIIYYDTGLRDKMEAENTLMPTEPDTELLNKYVKFSQKEREKEKEKKKAKPKGKGGKSRDKKEKPDKVLKTGKNEKADSGDVTKANGTNGQANVSKELEAGNSRSTERKNSLSPRPQSRSSSASSVRSRGKREEPTNPK